MGASLAVVLFAPLGLFDPGDSPPIHPSGAFHLGAESGAPGVLELPRRRMEGAADDPWARPVEDIVRLRPSPIIDAAIVRSVSSVRASFGQNEPALILALTHEGAQRMAEATSTNVGRQLAVVANGQVVSLAVIQAEIPHGQLMITGLGSLNEARALAASLHDANPAPPAEL